MPNRMWSSLTRVPRLRGWFVLASAAGPKEQIVTAAAEPPSPLRQPIRPVPGPGLRHCPVGRPDLAAPGVLSVLDGRRIALEPVDLRPGNCRRPGSVDLEQPDGHGHPPSD